MIPVRINNLSYFFSVVRITKESKTRLIYEINLNSNTYFFIKTVGINDCEQLDANVALGPILFDELCGIITEIEKAYRKRPSLDIINQEIFKILGRIRSPLFKIISTKG